MIKKIIFTLIALMLLPVAVSAQKPSDRDRKAWMKEMQQYKNEFMTRKLGLTDEQKAKFLPVYKRMECEVRAVNDQTMKMERDLRDKKDVTDLEYEKLAEAQFELKAREAQIELKYFKEFKTILTPAQLVKLKKAERDFSRQLMKKHQEHSAEKRRK
ncbi:MAG: Spy/CpxP family protein refolding chaperone [Duncaniella sp.]|nr:Spy/CpxP family protein refolding chaperone [Duncaniella sp.]